MIADDGRNAPHGGDEWNDCAVFHIFIRLNFVLDFAALRQTSDLFRRLRRAYLRR